MNGWFFPQYTKLLDLKLFSKRKIWEKKIVTPPPSLSLSLSSVSSRIVEITGNNNLVNYLKGKKCVHMCICVVMPSQNSGRRNRNVHMSLVNCSLECLQLWRIICNPPQNDFISFLFSKWEHCISRGIPTGLKIWNGSWR
jgi:hypothetical protein